MFNNPDIVYFVGKVFMWQDGLGEPVEGWAAYWSKHDHAIKLATSNGTKANMENLETMLRECGFPEYSERSH